MNDETHVLNEAIDQFLADQGEGVISASRVVNPLLNIWQLANNVDHAAAIPIEQLLTVLPGRKITTPLELTGTMDAVREALALLVAV